MLNALDARERGATVLTRTAGRLGAARRRLWRATTSRTASGEARQIARARARQRRRALGRRVIGRVEGATLEPLVRLVKGSHIVTPKFCDGPAGLSGAEPR